MGLGKSFQSIATMWTLLTASPRGGGPSCSRVLILAPSSLVTNWARELTKWLGDRVRPVVVEDTAGAAVKKQLAALPPPVVVGRPRTVVLIISYTTFRMHRQAIYGKGFELLICDEASFLALRVGWRRQSGGGGRACAAAARRPSAHDLAARSLPSSACRRTS